MNSDGLYGRAKKYAYEFFDMNSEISGDDPSEYRPARAFDYFITALILLNVVSFMLNTFRDYSVRYSFYFECFEIFTVAVFTIEFSFRLWSCTLHPGFERPVIGRLRYMASPWALIDLASFLPFYFPMLIPFDLRFIRVIRLMQLVRVFKLGKYNRKLKLFAKVIAKKRDDLMLTLMMGIILIFISSSLMFYIENRAQPGRFGNIFQALWWGLIPVTTVGYGDIYPVTPLGKALSAISTIAGLLIVSLPVAIFSSGFLEEINEEKSEEEKAVCPFCGSDRCPYYKIPITDLNRLSVNEAEAVAPEIKYPKT
jgi:voltage-gated potassium channel